MTATIEQPASQALDCYHCGSRVPRGAPWSICLDEVEHPLCCPGCEAVAHAIIEGGLASYYRFRTELPERPDERQVAKTDTWLIFDDPGLQQRFVHPEPDDQGVNVALAVEGITCAACAWLIEHRLNALEGILSSAVNLSHHRLRVAWDPERLSLSRILAELAAIGYPSQPYEPDAAQVRLQHEERMSIRRLIVAAAGMMQVMMFSIPHYVAGEGGISADFSALFLWLSFALTTPVVLFSAQPFFRGALRDIRSRQLGMDVPVSLAIGSAYLASAWAVIFGGDVYFDSVVMFTFFLLFGRYVEMRARRRSGRIGNALAQVLPLSATRLEDDDQERIVPASELHEGDRILVKPGYGVPADGIVEDGESSLDESMLSGEYLPVSRALGDGVTGGSQNIESPLVIRVTRAGKDARAASIVDLTDRAFAHRPRIAETTARLAHHFVLQVLILAVVVGVVWWFIDPQRAFWVTLSVLVITCPCALALATPTALTAAHGQLRRRGVLITRADALDTLSNVDRVIFDKTGTLTAGEMTLSEVRPLDDGDNRYAKDDLTRIAAALETQSEHPIAQAFSPYRDHGLSAEAIVNRPGQGLEGRLHDRLWRLGKPDFAAPDQELSPPSDGQWLLLSEQGRPRAWFGLSDRLREDAAETVAALTAMGLRVELLSGDTATATEAMAGRLGIEQWRGGVGPEGKLEHLRQRQAKGERVAMVGDGINDVPVLAGADVAIAMNGATDLARTRADAVLLGPRLMRIVEAISVSRATGRIIRQNLAWALVYNICALPLAMLGFVTPWIAAIGMSASSLIVVGNALRLARSTPLPQIPAARSETPAA